MRVEGLTIALRPRTPWEAVDLGVALVRRHARAIFGSWLLASGAVFVLLNALLLPFDLAWLAGLLLWWLKPAFDRMPVYLLSRAILGEAPGVRETLRAFWRRDWRTIAPWLLWRRLHPARAMLLPVDLLERPTGAARGERCRVLTKGEGSTPVLLWLIGVHLELMLWLSVLVFGLMLVPTEFLSDSAKAMFDLIVETPPWWVQLANNALYWLAMAAIEPFYVGAGFAQYLNRRTQLEAWDIEFAFRRLAARLAHGSSALLLLAIIALPTARAQTDDETGAAAARASGDAVTLDEALPSQRRVDRAAFEQAVERAMQDPLLSPREAAGEWRRRNPSADKPSEDARPPDWAASIGAFLAFVLENIGWLLLAVAALLLLLNLRRWLPWLRRGAAAAPVAGHEAIQTRALPDALPADPAQAALALWQQGEPRAALSLLYRAALAALVQRIGTPLPPGATEADGLRAARRLSAPDFVSAFRDVVACWQGIAYAQRLPADADFHALLERWRAAEPPR